ncbi:MAG: 30S ribosomal protein S5 [Candidatus Levybacteria bacterium]|nr:30S ribosomal protein S5 [Candidatus Levybacteria bacterium]
MNDSRFSKAKSPDGFEEKIVQVNRVSKKTKGGNKIGFSVLVVVGDKKGKVGVGLGKAPDISAAIKKGVSIGKKHLITVPIINGTIPFEFNIELGAAKIMIKPAPRGSGVIAGGAVRSVVAAAGIENISSKVLGTKNQASNVYATITALKRMTERYNKERKIK